MKYGGGIIPPGGKCGFIVGGNGGAPLKFIYIIF